jgi:hypothetical protein
MYVFYSWEFQTKSKISQLGLESNLLDRIHEVINITN